MVGVKPPPAPYTPPQGLLVLWDPRHPAHPLFVQFEELLGDFGGADGQAEAMDVEFRNDVFQGVF